MVKIGDKLDLNITDIGVNGEGIAHHENYTVFVPLALKGETVVAKVEHVSKTLVFSKLSKVLTASLDRVDPPCKYYYQCGGCDIMHVEYETQLEYKRAALKTTISKMIKSDFEVLKVTPSDKQLHYRNKVQLPFGIKDGKVILGFYKKNTHDIIPIYDCLLHGAWLKPLIRLTLDYANANNISVFNEDNGVLRHLVARYISDKLCVTLVVTNKNLSSLDTYYEELSKEFSDVSLYLNINTENTNVIMGKTIIHIAGPVQNLEVMGVNVSLNPLSFFQINDNIREKLYSRVISLISPSPTTTIIDAYSGVGLMGAIMAKSGAHIINIDEIPEAIDDANELYKSNGLLAQVSNICGDCTDVFPAIIPTLDPTHQIVLILDPPRKGVSEKLIETIKMLYSSVSNFKLIYISCNPATLARDLSNLVLDSSIVVAPYDMFAQTKHLETLVCMTRK